MGLCGLVILFACVRRPPAKRKSHFLPLVCLVCFACLLSASLSVCVSIHARKAALFVGRSFSLGLWCLVSPIERKYRRLQAGCRFGLLLLSCLCLSAFLLPWGLRYNKDLLYRLRLCGLYNGILLLCFSWSRGFSN